jgi:hypothetical protein
MSTDPYDIRGLVAQSEEPAPKENVAPVLTSPGGGPGDRDADGNPQISSFAGPGQTLSPEEVAAVLAGRYASRDPLTGIPSDPKNR